MGPMLLAILAWAPGVQEVSLGGLLQSSYDLRRLPQARGYRTIQFSSYDRRSSVPGDAGWFANSDGFGGEPIPGFEAVLREPGADGIGEYLVCDLRQPGAIVRTWTAAIEGTLRVEVDDAEEPLFEGPAADFLLRRYEHFVRTNVDDDAQRAKWVERAPAFQQRFADYFPLPFAKRCRIVWIGDLKRVHFYHVEARLYPEGTSVDPIWAFDEQDGTVEIGIEEAWQASFNPHHEALGSPAATIPGDADLAAGESRELISCDGPAEIQSLRASVEADDVAAALRGCVLSIRFDDAAVPQVLAPLGDFFATAPGVVPYTSLPMSVEPDGSMECRFVMPFARRASISVENRSRAAVRVHAEARRVERTLDAPPMHFHARWRVDHDLFAGGRGGVVDLPFLVARGSGTYVGTAVHLMNPCPVPTSGGNWWGEGDEKILVDDDARPSFFGTGSEDYFNYAWSQPDHFSYPFFAQPLSSGPDNRGYVTNVRWHVADPIPFERGIAFYMELYTHTPTEHLSYARTSYFYARPGLIDDTPPIEDGDLVVPPLRPWKPLAAGAARDATFFEAEDLCGDEATIVDDVCYASGKLARFAAGSTVSLAFDAPATGRFELLLTCASGPELACFEASLDDRRLTARGDERVALSTSHLERLVNESLGTHELDAGRHVLTLHVLEGSLGVDFVWIRPRR